MVDKSIIVRIIGESGQFVTAMSTAGASVQNFGNQAAVGANKAQGAVQGFSQTAANAGKIATLGIAAGLALSAKAALDFESSFAGVRKTVDASEAGFAKLSADIRQLATDIPISVNELARIGELGGQLGVGIGGLPDFIETIGKIGVTTTLTTEQAALGFARLDNILQLNQQSFENLGSTIVDLGNNFAATEDEILAFSLRIAPAAKTIGITADEVLAISTAFASVGVPAERGGTAVQKTLIAISEAAQSGGENLRRFADIAGVTSEQFQDLVTNDPARAFAAFVDGLQRVRAEGKNVFAVLDSVGLGNERVRQALLAAANATGLLGRALQTSERAWEQNIALTEEAEKRFATTESRIALARNQIQDLAIEIGNELLPVIGDLADSFQDLIFGFQSLDPAAKKMIAALAGIVVGATLAQTSYKLLARVIGVDIVAAMNAGTVATVAFKTAIGAGFALLLIGITNKLQEYGEKKRDVELRTRALTDAILEERDGMEDLAFETLRQQLIAEGVVDSLNDLGIGVNTFTRAILGEGDALDIVQKRFNEVGEEVDSVYSQLESSIAGTGEESRRAADRYEIAQRQAQALAAVQGILRGRTDEYALAQSRANEELDAIVESRTLDALAEGYDSIDEQQKELALSTAAAVSEFGNLPDIAVLLDDAIDDVSKSVQEYDKFLTEAFEDTNEGILDQIDLWGELGDAVEINVNDIISNVTEQVETQRAFQELLAGFNISPAVRALFDEWSLEQQAGFVKLADEAPAEAQRLVDFLETIWGPGGEILQTAAIAFSSKLPDLIAEGGGKLVGELRAIAERVAAESGADPVEAWLGTIETALAVAPTELQPAILEALRQAFIGSGFTGELFGLGSDAMQGFIDGMYALFPELANVVFGIKDVVTKTVAGQFQAFSPSRLMMGYGADVATGFALGMDKAAGQLFPDMPPAFMRKAVVPQGTSNSQVITNNNQQAPTTVIIQDSLHHDLQSDISAGLIAGGVNRQVETLVRRTT